MENNDKPIKALVNKSTSKIEDIHKRPVPKNEKKEIVRTRL